MGGLDGEEDINAREKREEYDYYGYDDVLFPPSSSGKVSGTVQQWPLNAIFFLFLVIFHIFIKKRTRSGPLQNLKRTWGHD